MKSKKCCNVVTNSWALVQIKTHRLVSRLGAAHQFYIDRAIPKKFRIRTAGYETNVARVYVGRQL